MDCAANYKQSLPLAWLQAPTEKNRAALLEFSRGTLYSLSNSSRLNGGEVHTSSFRHAFERLRSANLARVGLRLMKLLRETEPLPGGYWLPTPFRVLQLESDSIFIGAFPTALGHFEQETREGLYRRLAPEAASNLPHEDLDSWMGTTFSSPASQISNLIKCHQNAACPISEQNEIEFFYVAPSSSKRTDNARSFLWKARPSSTIYNNIVLCRQRRFGFSRYFSSDLRFNRAISEAKIEQPPTRLMFAIAHELGSPVPVTITTSQGEIQISISEQLPTEEYRLALLLSHRIEYQGHRRTFHISPNLAITLIERLKTLGCFVEIAN
jgi:hypothetical protein